LGIATYSGAEGPISIRILIDFHQEFNATCFGGGGPASIIILLDFYCDFNVLLFLVEDHHIPLTS
jgi:hypothetical protein